MAAIEKRFPRATFTRKLMRICERLDASSTHALSFKHWFFDRQESATSTATSLWVVGSYARGAFECGDLDLVLEVQSVGSKPPERTLMKALTGAPTFVRCYAGTPAENSSGIEFPNPRLIWTEPGCDWKAAIEAIAPDPSAGRAKRPIDALPFRIEQLDAQIEHLEELLKLRRKGLIEWNFVPFSKNALLPMLPSAFKHSEEYVARAIELEMAGKKTLQLLPPLTRAMRKIEPHGVWRSDYGRLKNLWCGGTLLRFGHPHVSTHSFDDEPRLWQLGIAPHLSARGPNGIWLIRRGPRHPDTLALATAKFSAFYLVEDGAPFVVTWVDNDRGYERETKVLDLFATPEDALRDIEEWQEDVEPSARPIFEVAELNGGNLLKLTGLCDVVKFGETELAMTHSGAGFAGLEQPSKIADIITALSQ